MSVSRQFSDALARRLGVDPEATFRLLSAWQPFEGGSEDNPLNTTEDMPGATNWNGVGVKRYASIDDGVEATARTLENGLYGNILAGLKSGKVDASMAPDIRTWTSGSPQGGSHFADQMEGGVNGRAATADDNIQMASDTPAGGGTGGSSTPRRAVDPKTLKNIQDGVAALLPGVLAGDTESFKNYMIGLATLQQYQATGSLTTIEDDAAQKAFDNSIKLGDYQSNKANDAYARWKDKRDAARTLATGQIQDAFDRNAAKANTVANTRSDSWATTPEAATYFAPNYDDALKRWNDKVGVGGEPSSDPSTYGGPRVPSSQTAGGGTTTGEGTFSLNYRGAGPDRQGNWAPDPSVGGISDSGRTFEGRPYGIGYDPAGAPTQAPPVEPSSWQDRFGDIMGGASILPRIGAGAGALGIKKFRGLIGLKGGGRDLQHGVYQVGEQGLEHAVTREGQVVPLGQDGPEVAMLPQGTDVLPSDVPPDQAMAHAQIRRAIAADQGGNPGQDLNAQYQRANDPQLQEKVLASLQKAFAAHDAQHPPLTPQLIGNWTSDPWANWRPMTGIGVDGQPMQQPQQAGGVR
jgi:hypothetical protein